MKTFLGLLAFYGPMLALIRYLYVIGSPEWGFRVAFGLAVVSVFVYQYLKDGKCSL